MKWNIPYVWPRTLGAIVLLYAVARWFEWKSLYHPWRELYETPADYHLDFEDVRFETADGKLLQGWWFPVPDAAGSVVVCHGNGGNIGNRVWMAQGLMTHQLNVFLFDYRGYGNSRGMPTEKGTYKDAVAAWDVAMERHTGGARIAYGRSLGGAVAIELARRRNVDALIIESAFTSVPDMSKHLYPWLPLHFIASFRYASIRKIHELNMPKLFAHSPDDRLIPIEQGRQLYEAAPEPKRFFELQGGHDDSGWVFTPGYHDAIGDFVRSLQKSMQ